MSINMMMMCAIACAGRLGRGLRVEGCQRGWEHVDERVHWRGLPISWLIVNAVTSLLSKG